jgi:hypothetical protein
MPSGSGGVASWPILLVDRKHRSAADVSIKVMRSKMLTVASGRASGRDESALLGPGFFLREQPLERGADMRLHCLHAVGRRHLMRYVVWCMSR